MKKILLTVSLAILAGCGDQPQNYDSDHRPIVQQTHHAIPGEHYQRDCQVQEYRQNTGNNDWLYWYIIYSNSWNHQYPCYYYYSSPTPITNYSTANFTSAGKTLPPEIEKDIASSEKVGNEVPLPENAEPKDIVIQESDFEKAEAPADVNIVDSSGNVVPVVAPSAQSAPSAEPSAPAAESAPASDGGGTGGGGGGTDGGGGDGGGGGGGGE